MLQTYYPIAQAIATLLSPYAEVVIHDLSTQTVAFIANNWSNREPGSPSLLEDIDFSDQSEVIGPYEKRNWDGRTLKSITSVLKNDEGKAIGLLCINLDVHPLTQVQHILSMFLNAPNLQKQPDELFKEDWSEKINQFIHQHLAQSGQTLESLSKADKKRLITTLKAQGAFEGKYAADHVGKILRLSRATVYKILREFTP